VRRSIWAVLVGTFTLRFSTGLTGALLATYFTRLPELGIGIGEISATAVGAMAATYFLAELLLSPFFGVLADRIGTRRVMQIGPLFGAVAVAVTPFLSDLFLLGGTRWLEGMAAAASIPSILGFIAAATSGDEWLRGRVVARFEAATLAGIGLGVVAGPVLFELLGTSAFFLNAVIYGLSFAIYRFGVSEPADQALPIEPALERGSAPGAVARYRRLLTSSRVWLLAPTWIALNAIVGVWTSQSIFQLVRVPSGRFDDQLLMGGFAPWQVSIGLAVWLAVFFAGLFYWGNRFKTYRRTSIIGIGIAGGLIQVSAVFGLNHSIGWPMLGQVGLAVVAAAGLFVLAGGTPAALGLLADISEGHPHDRGAIMGLYSVFLGVGQIIGALTGGPSADWLGIDGLLAVSMAMLLIALLPLHRLRASEHLLEAAEMAAEARRSRLAPVEEPGS
jgi:MFS family permease